jgi:hypothetical protein
LCNKVLPHLSHEIGGGGADEDVISRIKEANVASVQLYRIWKNNIGMKPKLKILNSNVKAVLLLNQKKYI